MIGVLIADDQDLVRIGLRALIEAEDDMRVAGEAADGLTAVALARQVRPEIILMDVRMPGIDGIEATRRLAADPSMTTTRVIVLTTFELDEYVFDALRQGASGFLTKDTKPAELLRAIRLVVHGEALLTPSVTRRVIREFAARPARATRIRTSSCSPSGSGRSSGSSAKGSATTRSPNGSWSAPPPPAPTSAGPWSSWAPATAPNWSSSPTSQDSSTPEPWGDQRYAAAAG